VRAQTACEMYARLALDHLAEDLPEGDGRGSSLFPGSNAVGSGATAPYFAPSPTMTMRGSGVVDCLSHPRRTAPRDRPSRSVGMARRGSRVARCGPVFIAFLQDRWATRALGRPPIFIASTSTLSGALCPPTRRIAYQ